MNSRSEIYHKSKAKSHRDLPPTSQGIVSHISRAFYNTHCIINSIKKKEEESEILYPLDWGFILDRVIQRLTFLRRAIARARLHTRHKAWRRAIYRTPGIIDNGQ